MPNTPAQWIANGDIRPCRFIKADVTAGKDHYALECDANDRIDGISQEGTNKAQTPDITATLAAAAAEQFRAFGPGDQCLLELGGTVVQGDRLKSDADGKGVAIATSGTTIQQIGARALSAGASGEKIPVEVTIYSERPALS